MLPGATNSIGNAGMRTVWSLAVAGVVAILVAAGAYLAFVGIPAPTAETEKVIPNDRFRR